LRGLRDLSSHAHLAVELHAQVTRTITRFDCILADLASDHSCYQQRATVAPDRRCQLLSSVYDRRNLLLTYVVRSLTTAVVRRQHQNLIGRPTSYCSDDILVLSFRRSVTILRGGSWKL